MYRLFLDETGDHSLKVIDKQYPIFILAGCIFKEDYYEEVVVPKIEQFKRKYLKKSDVVLHSYEIRKQKNDFKILANKKIRESFYNELFRLISSFKFHVVASAIRKEELNKIKHRLKKISNDPYEISFEFVLERFLKYLDKNDDVGELSFESRDDHSNINLLNLYEKFKIKGASNIRPETIKNRIMGISFPFKKANIAGHQIADIIAYPIARHILNPQKENKLFKIIWRKFLRDKYGRLEGHGLKLFPKERYRPKIRKGPRIS